MEQCKKLIQGTQVPRGGASIFRDEPGEATQVPRGRDELDRDEPGRGNASATGQERA